MKEILEKYLWDSLSPELYKAKPFARDIISEMVIKGLINSPKQAWRTLEKWCDKGIYEYGCCLDLGWKCKKVINERKD